MVNMSNRRRILLVAFTIVVCGVAAFTYYLTPSNAKSEPFQLKVINRPAYFGDVVYSIPGQRCIFLVSLIENQTSKSSDVVKLSVTSLNCEVSVYPFSIKQGQVAEVTVKPITSNIGKNVTVTLVGERGEAKQTISLNTEVIEGEDTLEAEASEKRDMFMTWLSENHAELGISEKTVWTATVVNPRVLVVTHYLFLSEEWEMYLTWHIMIPPYDWAKIYLRHRFDKTAPTYAFEISSIQGKATPVEIDVPDWV